jgi:hypothetical protein
MPKGAPAENFEFFHFGHVVDNPEHTSLAVPIKPAPITGSQGAVILAHFRFPFVKGRPAAAG